MPSLRGSIIEKGKGYAVHLCCASRGGGVGGDRRLRRRRARRSRARASPVRTCTRTSPSISCTARGAGGPVPLTLQEALAKGNVQVVETGRVNELQIENTGGEQVFIQAGDIVKGGKQDRVLTVSLLLPAKSGRVPIASFCVEQGRWSARGKEDHAKFSSAKEAMPSRAALLAMAAPPREPAAGAAREAGPRIGWPRGATGAASSAARVRRDRRASSARSGTRLRPRRGSSRSGLGAAVASPQSASSLQLVAGEREAEGGARRLHQGAAAGAARRTATSSATSSPSTAR